MFHTTYRTDHASLQNNSDKVRLISPLTKEQQKAKEKKEQNRNFIIEMIKKNFEDKNYSPTVESYIEQLKNMSDKDILKICYNQEQKIAIQTHFLDHHLFHKRELFPLEFCTGTLGLVAPIIAFLYTSSWYYIPLSGVTGGLGYYIGCPLSSYLKQIKAFNEAGKFMKHEVNHIRAVIREYEESNLSVESMQENFLPRFDNTQALYEHAQYKSTTLSASANQPLLSDKNPSDYDSISHSEEYAEKPPSPRFRMIDVIAGSLHSDDKKKAEQLSPGQIV